MAAFGGALIVDGAVDLEERELLFNGRFNRFDGSKGTNISLDF